MNQQKPLMYVDQPASTLFVRTTNHSVSFRYFPNTPKLARLALSSNHGLQN